MSEINQFDENVDYKEKLNELAIELQQIFH